MNTDPWPYELCPRLLGMHEAIAESKTTATRGSYLALTGGDLIAGGYVSGLGQRI